MLHPSGVHIDGDDDWARKPPKTSIRNLDLNERRMLLAAISVPVIHVALDVRPRNGDLDGLGGFMLEQEHILLGHIVERCEAGLRQNARSDRSEEHTSELQSLMRISYAVFC